MYAPARAALRSALVRRAKSRLVVGLTTLGVALAAVTAVTVVAGPAAAATYYVSGSGNDGGDGSSGSPWRTLARAASAAPAGASIRVRAGTYQPFTVTRANQTFAAVAGQAAVVVGRAGVQDVIRVAAGGVRLSGMTVRGCVPNANPPGGFEHGGSSAIRVDDGAHDVTIEQMTIADSRATNAEGLRFGCYGVLVHYADRTSILRNDISGTGGAIYFNGGGVGARITGNRLHDNDVIIRNTYRADDDFGGNAVTFTNLYGAPGPRATGNTIFNNAGPSRDYGYDGGAFEIYNARNVLIDGNVLSNNENVLETGTYPGGDCSGNAFSGNQVTGRTQGSRLPQTIGMILRCANGMKIENNTFSGLEWRLFYIGTNDMFSSNVDRLTIRNNTITMYQPVYHLGVYPSVAGLVVDGNRYRTSASAFATYGDGTQSADFWNWRSRTGLDAGSSTF